MTVSGEPGEAPTITYVTPLQVDKTRTEQIWPGTGAALVEGAAVLIDFWLEDATDASLVKESYSTNPTAMLLTEEDLGTDLYSTLHGQKVGARLLQVSPGSGSGRDDYPTVTVVDVLPTRADGEPVPPRAGPARGHARRVGRAVDHGDRHGPAGGRSSRSPSSAARASRSGRPTW